MKTTNLNASQKTKKTPIGDLPVDWKLLHFGEIAQFKNGLNFLRSESGSTYRIIGVTGFQRLFRPDASSYEEVSLGRELDPGELLQNDDLLFVRSNGNRALIGRCMIIPELSRPTGFSGFTIRARVLQRKALPEFVARFMCSWQGRQQMLRLGGGTNISNLSQDILGEIVVPLPPLPEQREIAAILSTWDRAIFQTEQLIQAKQQLKKGLMQRLLTGQLRFPRFGPAAAAGHLARGWQRARLGTVTKRILRRVEDATGVEPLSVTATVGFVPQREKFSRVIAGAQLGSYILLRRGEFAYNKGNSDAYPQGCVYQLREFETGAVPHVYFCFAAEPAQLEAGYLSHYAAGGMLNHELAGLINSGVRNDGLLNLSAHAFFGVQVLLPPLAEQEAIAACLNAQDAEIADLAQQLAALQQQKRGLMQKLLTGQIRVKGAKQVEA